jgi:hypothetical protein
MTKIPFGDKAIIQQCIEEDKDKTLEVKTVKWGSGHVFDCLCCFDMERRGYESENDYWDDFFERKLKPVAFKLVKGWGK